MTEITVDSTFDYVVEHYDDVMKELAGICLEPEKTESIDRTAPILDRTGDSDGTAHFVLDAGAKTGGEQNAAR